MQISVRASLSTALLCAAFAPLSAQVNVTTYHNDVARTGQNTQEAYLTPGNVTARSSASCFGGRRRRRSTRSRCM